MAVTVYLHEGDDVVHQSGTKWTVDDRGHLHVIGNGATVATYAIGCWQAVSVSAGLAPCVSAETCERRSR